MNSAKYTNQTKPKVTFISGMAKKGQKSNLWSQGGWGAVHHPGADRLHTHTGRASPSETQRTNMLGMGGMAGLPRWTTRTICMQTNGLGTGPWTELAPMRNTLVPLYHRDFSVTI